MYTLLANLKSLKGHICAYNKGLICIYMPAIKISFSLKNGDMNIIAKDFF